MVTNNKTRSGEDTFTVRLPASTSNLGAGIDCFGLALQRYLSVRAVTSKTLTQKCRVRTSGTRESAELPRNEENLIYRAMAFAARSEGVTLPPLQLAVRNEILLGRGFGSSAAAIVAGVKLCGLIGERELSNEKVLEYATRFEGHPDNVAAALYGGFVTTCITSSGAVFALNRPWPAEVKILAVSPGFHLSTKLARETLTRSVSRIDAVYNLQRSALFVGALASARYELIWEAMHDRLHQERRQTLVPGLADVLALPRMDGLLGLALSGAGPSVLALVTGNYDVIAEAIAACFRRYKVKTTSARLEVDTEGCQTMV
ncbi:MAG TPA: homoserine kinase [Pyrinomonadaceae bacterium]